MQDSSNLTPQAAAANEQVARNFEADVDTQGTASPDGSTEITEDAWNKAQYNSNELYRSLFGSDSFNRHQMAASMAVSPEAPPSNP